MASVEDAPLDPPPVRLDAPPVRVLLVGFMGSGKTTVGRRLARLLGWSFHDFDREVTSEAGATIPEIFARDGEARFREMEERIGRSLLQKERVVLASGGGWGAREERLEAVPPRTLSVWLRVSPEEAVRRARSEGAVRPLLEVPDPLARARTLLEERSSAYSAADVVLDTEEASPESLARTIFELMRRNPRNR